jgi:phosphinothricin acetyltransferase
MAQRLGGIGDSAVVVGGDDTVLCDQQGYAASCLPGVPGASSAIYQAGIDEGNATFETTAPTWPAFDAAKLTEHRFVARRTRGCAWPGRRHEGVRRGSIQSGIFPESTDGLALHERAGFRVIGTRERIGRRHGRWRDVVLVERRSFAVR